MSWRGRRERAAAVLLRGIEWSGARDLNPGPHGPEPYRMRVLGCPAGSASARLNSSRAAYVS
jgi:hypothetical protein